MAEHRGAARNRRRPWQQPIEAAGVLADDPNQRDRAQRLCLDAGRALVLCGALVAGVPSAFDIAAADANTTRALVGFLLWILGACLCFLALTPAAPWAVRAGAAAVSTVLMRCLSLL